MTHDSEDEPMRGQPEMVGNRLSGYITVTREDFVNRAIDRDCAYIPISGLEGRALQPPETVAFIAKLEAEAEVMRKTITEMLEGAWDIRAREDRIDAQDATIRRLADENAMLKWQLSDFGLRIYGTDTPECGHDQWYERSETERQCKVCGVTEIGTDTPECPDQVLGDINVRCSGSVTTAHPFAVCINAPSLATGPQGLPE
jgi:hypothetical protein